LVDSPQFLLILAAEAEHLVTVSIELSAASHHDLQRSLTDAFASTGYSDAAKAWNDQRALVIQEAVEKHLIPMGTKWIREWVRDEAQNNLARKCGEVLRQVRVIFRYTLLSTETPSSAYMLRDGTRGQLTDWRELSLCRGARGIRRKTQ
jgi:hypothetical protein